MKFRRQLTVASPLAATNIIGATIDTFTRRDLGARVRSALTTEFDASEVILTDSGTSALVLALRIVGNSGAPVAMPAYACVDLIAAARRAGVRVRLFDVDPQTLSPDVDSLRRVIAEGVSAVVVAHLYGFPADMTEVMSAADEAGVPVIEDAAQHACATIGGKATGSFGDLTVLSFGRGKGTTSGHGGALMSRGRFAGALRQLSSGLATTSSGKALTISAASWTLGRPSVYGIPAAIPALHLGETVYHEASEPQKMSRAATALLHRTFSGMHQAATVRRRNALVLGSAADQSRHIRAVHAIEKGESGYLRFPVLLHDARYDETLGIAHGYPRPLSQEPEMEPCMVPSNEPLHGAHELARRLVTLPTHHMVTRSDLAAMIRWLDER
jgi:dTDP-4-amino-4,6-dideoxygalactose transaminase